MSELDSARRLIARGKSEQASRLLAELIAEHPDKKEAWLLMAKAVKDPQQKLDCFQRVLEIDPEDPIAKKGIEESKHQVFIGGVKNQIEQSRSKTLREKKANPENSSEVKLLGNLLKTRYLLPIFFFILLTVIAFLVFKNRPLENVPSSTGTLAAPIQETQTATFPTKNPTAIPSENPQKIFASQPFLIYYAVDGKLWVWQDGAAKSISEIDPATLLLANQQTGQVVFTLHGILWEVDPTALLAKALINPNIVSKETPSPTTSSETIFPAGIIPGTNEILFSTFPGSELSMAQSDGSGITQLLTSGEIGTTYPSPDGKWLAVVNRSSIRLLSLSGKTILGILDYAPVPTTTGYLLPVPQWAEDSSRFLVAIPPADFANDLNAPTSLWQMNSNGQKTPLGTIQSRGGTIFFSADLSTVFYQLNLSSVSDYYGELHKANIDGNQDAILVKGQLAHLIGMDANGSQIIFQLKDDPRSIQVQDESTIQYHRLLTGLETETVLSVEWLDEQTFLYQTLQTDSYNLWLGRYDGSVHPPLLLANAPGSEILFCFTTK